MISSTISSKSIKLLINKKSWLSNLVQHKLRQEGLRGNCKRNPNKNKDSKMDGVTDQDFNASSGNLGGDLQSLEERGLFWTQSGGLSRHMDIQGSKGTCLGWGFHLEQWGIHLIYQRSCHKTRKHTSIAENSFYQEKYCIVLSSQLWPFNNCPLSHPKMESKSSHRCLPC